jgi:alpha-1,3-glucosyltransferase
MRLSTLLTLVGFLGAAIAPTHAWLRLRSEKRSTELPPVMQTVVLPTLLNSSMSFFLFSFRVHEKTILLPPLPLTRLLSTAPHDLSTFKLGVLANNVGVFRCVPIFDATSNYNDFAACGPSRERTGWPRNMSP